MKTIFTSLGFICCLVALAQPALASSPTSFVGGPSVKKGKLSIEHRMGYTEDHSQSSDDHRIRMRQHIDYGLTDYYAIRMVTSQDRRHHQNFEHQAITIENRFHLIDKKDHGWNGGLRLIYAHNDGDKKPDKAEIRLMSEFFPAEGWRFRNNTRIEHQVGSNATDGPYIELRNQLAKIYEQPHPAVKSLALGFEMFNDFHQVNHMPDYEEQDHQLGGMAKVAFNNGLYFQTGYRAGISHDSPNHLFYFALGKNF